jgi:hypothetical protein
MPLAEFEREVLGLIARNRNPDSFIAGATVLHQSPTSPRPLRDVDVFMTPPKVSPAPWKWTPRCYGPRVPGVGGLQN